MEPHQTINYKEYLKYTDDELKELCESLEIISQEDIEIFQKQFVYKKRLKKKSVSKKSIQYLNSQNQNSIQNDLKSDPWRQYINKTLISENNTNTSPNEVLSTDRSTTNIFEHLEVTTCLTSHSRSKSYSHELESLHSTSKTSSDDMKDNYSLYKNYEFLISKYRNLYNYLQETIFKMTKNLISLLRHDDVLKKGISNLVNLNTTSSFDSRKKSQRLLNKKIFTLYISTNIINYYNNLNIDQEQFKNIFNFFYFNVHENYKNDLINLIIYRMLSDLGESSILKESSGTNKIFERETCNTSENSQRVGRVLKYLDLISDKDIKHFNIPLLFTDILFLYNSHNKNKTLDYILFHKINNIISVSNNDFIKIIHNLYKNKYIFSNKVKKFILSKFNLIEILFLPLDFFKYSLEKNIQINKSMKFFEFDIDSDNINKFCKSIKKRLNKMKSYGYLKNINNVKYDNTNKCFIFF